MAKAKKKAETRATRKCRECRGFGVIGWCGSRCTSCAGSGRGR